MSWTDLFILAILITVVPGFIWASIVTIIAGVAYIASLFEKPETEPETRTTYEETK